MPAIALVAVDQSGSDLIHKPGVRTSDLDYRPGYRILSEPAAEVLGRTTYNLNDAAKLDRPAN